MLENPTQISCDSGDCFYTNTISWRNPTTPNPTEAHPANHFFAPVRRWRERGAASGARAEEREHSRFGDAGSRAASTGVLARAIMANSPSIWIPCAKSSAEFRMRNRRERRSVDLPERPIDIPESFDEHAKLMFDLQALAYQADITRVFTMVMGRELSARTFPNIGVPEQHHAVSHHRNDPGPDCEEGEDRQLSHPAAFVFSAEAAVRRPMATGRCSITA